MMMLDWTPYREQLLKTIGSLERLTGETGTGKELVACRRKLWEYWTRRSC